ncbi:MAG: hypothetical protein SFV81_02370 [Pirellulaceae bacterium]|nr:hypothetical protein [Pirellulaceae bacterium]
MKDPIRNRCNIVAVVVALMLNVTFADNTFSDSTIADETVPARFVIVAPKAGVHAELGTSLFRVLRFGSQRGKFERVETIEEAVASQADIIVLAMPHRELPPIAKETLESLKQRKILGIGEGAAKLFGQLGLFINEKLYAGAGLPLDAMIPKSELLGEPATDETITVLTENSNAIRVNEAGERLRELSELFLPLNNSAGVDVIARDASNPNYALIARQGNCVLVGVASPATLWSKPYSQLIGDTCIALHRRKLEAFSKIRREVAQAGNYEFSLAPLNTVDKPFVKYLYFQFSKPTILRAELEHSGSAAVMLCTKSDRQDAFKGETLTTIAEITSESIQQLGDDYWELDITNFDAKEEAKCKLKITLEEP